MPPPPKDLRLDPPIPALHPERDALLAAIRDADPADDLPALVYADWQDENGQPEHAELIRVMVELAKARKRDSASKARRPVLHVRMKELLKSGPLEPLRDLFVNTHEIRRGFVPGLIVFWAEQPVGYPFQSRNLAGPPEHLDLPSVLPFDKVGWLGLQLIDWRKTDCPDRLLAALAAQPWLRRVDRLLLPPGYGSSMHIGSSAFGPLAGSPHLGGLRAFEVRGSTISAGELVRLYSAKSAVNLQVLELGQLERGVTPDDSRRPSRKAFLAAVEEIVSSRKAKKLTSLGGHFFTIDEALATILLASYLPDSRFQNCWFGKITAKTRARLNERFEWARGYA